jgi:alpha-tubulin suppressor-like RCC1 family protein
MRRISADKYSQITAGYEYTIVLSTNNQLYGYGDNQYGQIGDGTTTNSQSVKLTKMELFNGAKIVQIEAGSFHTVALTSDGRVFCWGYNSHGQIGPGGKQNAF